MFPAPYSVVQIPFADMGVDGMNNDAPMFSEPVTRKVYSASDHKQEPVVSGHTSRQVAEIDLAMPTVPVNLLDRWVWDGQHYETVGIRDSTKGFHGWKPGIVVELKRVTG